MRDATALLLGEKEVVHLRKTGHIYIYNFMMNKSC